MVGLLQAEAVLPHPVDCPCCSASRTSQQVVHRQSGFLSEEQEVGCEAGRGVRRVVCLHLMFMFTDVCACETRRREVDEACPDSQSTDAVTPGKKKKKKEFRLDSNDFGFI